MANIVFWTVLGAAVGIVLAGVTLSFWLLNRALVSCLAAIWRKLK